MKTKFLVLKIMVYIPYALLQREESEQSWKKKNWDEALSPPSSPRNPPFCSDTSTRWSSYLLLAFILETSTSLFSSGLLSSIYWPISCSPLFSFTLMGMSSHKCILCVYVCLRMRRCQCHNISSKGQGSAKLVSELHTRSAKITSSDP